MRKLCKNERSSSSPWFLPGHDDGRVGGVAVNYEGVRAPWRGAMGPQHGVREHPLERVEHAPIDLGLGQGRAPVHILQGRVRTTQRSARHAR